MNSIQLKRTSNLPFDSLIYLLCRARFTDLFEPKTCESLIEKKKRNQGKEEEEGQRNIEFDNFIAAKRPDAFTI